MRDCTTSYEKNQANREACTEEKDPANHEALVEPAVNAAKVITPETSPVIWKLRMIQAELEFKKRSG